MNDFSQNYYLLKDKTTDLSKYSLEELKHILKEAKVTYDEYDELQKVIKGDSNSIYGSTGNAYYKLGNADIAEDITTIAKHFATIADKAINMVFVEWGEKELSIIQQFYPNVEKLKQLEYKPNMSGYDVCIYGDTDSRYVNIDLIYNLLIEDGKQKRLPTDDKELVDFSIFIVKKFIDNAIKTSIDKDLEYRNMRKGYLAMAHEVTTRKCIIIKKKKYIMTQLWNKGKYFSKPKLKFMGVELKRGSTSPKMKKILTKLVEKALLENYTNDELRMECLKLIKYIKANKKKEYIYLISSVSGFKDINKDEKTKLYDSDKNHIQMQIALSWMNFIETNNLTDRYQKPFEGQKMNYYKCAPDSGYAVMGVPDDVNIDEVPGLPEPDWNQCILDSFIRPFYRYISDKKEIDDDDCNNFLIGVKRITTGIVKKT